MTVHKLSAGDGYAYYTREVASADELRAADRRLGDYYTVSGNPPGQWGGGGAHLLGVSGEVDEHQMELLYGQGLHPETGAKLGQRYKRMEQGNDEFSKRVGEALGAFQRLNHREPEADERRVLRAKVGGELFREIHGRNAKSKEELGQFMSSQGRPKGNAVAGYDLVFSPPKSVSVLWGVGGDEARTAIERAQHDAIEEAMSFVESNAAYTRRGKNGVRTEDVQDGLIYTSFRHYDSRNGDPQLHDHVVVSNKVMGTDGRWSALDGTVLYKYGVAASEVYNRAIIERVSRELGVAPVVREVPGKRPIVEIGGIDVEAIEAASSRRACIKETQDRLVDQFVADHGYAPSEKQLIAISQQATLETRPDKKKGQPLAELVTGWQEKFGAIPGITVGPKLLRQARAYARTHRDESPGDLLEMTDDDVRQVAQSVVETVQEQRTVWGEAHVIAETRRQIGLLAGAAEVPDELYDDVVDTVLDEYSLTVTPAPVTPAPVPGAVTDLSKYRKPGSALYTSERVLQDEDRLLRSAQHQVIPAATEEAFERVLAEHQGQQLNPAQIRLAREFATGDKLLIGGIGPAGAGKTTAMRLAADTVKDAGGRVLAVAPTAAAAALLGQDIDCQAMTIHRLLRTENKPTRDFVPLKAGDVVIVDEAGMVGTPVLANLLTLAEEAGAHVRLLGDDRQLASVGAGGALRLIDREVGLTRLEEVHRFRNPDGSVNTEEAEASLALREPPAVGPDDPWRFYFDQGRVVGGDTETMQDQVFEAWQRDTNRGRDSLMLAPTNDLVTELNTRAQVYRITAGELDQERYLELRGDARLHVGDEIVTRKNNSRLKVHQGKDFVKNNDAWTVTGIGKDGSVQARHRDHHGLVELPDWYVREHVDLGYASTVHRAQGRTVDTAHALISDSMDRAGVYVATSRGRYENRLYVDVAEGQSPADVLDTVAARQEQERSAHEAVDVERERARSLERLGGIYRDIHDMAESERLKNLARRTLDEPAAAALVASPAWDAVATRLRQAEDSGIAADVLLRDAYEQRDLGTADDPGAVIAWRMEPMLESYQLQISEEARPLRHVTDQHLRELNVRAQMLHSDIVAETRDLVAAEAIEAGVTPFDRRVYWHLGDERLAERIAETKGSLDRQIPSDPANQSGRLKWELRGLERERQLREQMPTPLREAEAGLRYRTLRREAAQSLVERTQDELSVRRITGESPAVRPDNRLGEWFAPTRTLTSPDTPRPWVEQLEQYRRTIEAEFDRVGARLAQNPPAWTAALGPLPSNPLRAKQWRDLAAEVSAYRQTYKIPDAEPSLIPASHAELEAGRDFTARATALHKHSALTIQPEPGEASRLGRVRQAEDNARTNVEPVEAEDVIGDLRRARQQDQAERQAGQQSSSEERIKRLLADRAQEADADQEPTERLGLREQLARLRRTQGERPPEPDIDQDQHERRGPTL